MRLGLFVKNLYFFTVFHMPWLSENEGNQALGMLAVGMSARVVAPRFGCCRKTIDHLAALYQQTGAVEDRQRPGRACVMTARGDRNVMTARGDRNIRLTHLHQHQLAATVTARQYGVSGQTIRNPPTTGQIMTQRHCAARLLWARRHLNLRRADWNRVLFTGITTGMEEFAQRTGIALRYADAA